MGKNYEEYIAELETELSDAKQSNAALRERVNSQETQIAQLKEAHAWQSGAHITEVLQLEDELQFERSLNAESEAITAWTMGFE